MAGFPGANAKKTKTPVFSLEELQKNPTMKKTLEGFVEEVVMLKKEVKERQESITDIRNEAKEALGVPGKVLMRLVRENMQPGSIESDIKDLDEISGIQEVLDGTVGAQAPISAPTEDGDDPD